MVIILMNYYTSFPQKTNLLSSHLFLPHITKTTRTRDCSKTLIDNIFSNTLIENTVSVNLTATISDHLSQFIILPNIFSNPPSNKSKTYEETGPILSKKTLYWTIFLLTGIL